MKRVPRDGRMLAAALLAVSPAASVMPVGDIRPAPAARETEVGQYRLLHQQPLRSEHALPPSNAEPISRSSSKDGCYRQTHGLQSITAQRRP